MQTSKNNIYKILAGAYALFIAVLFISCGPSTVITASWKSPSVPSEKYSRILVAALTSNTIAKVTLENEVALALGNGINVLKSISEFPPDIHNTDSDKETIMNNAKNKNVDAILTISLINKETETRYVPGSYSYNPIVGYNYYDNFWGYYSYRYPYSYDPGYYVQDKIYFIETNLYDVETEKLIWSAQSRTYNPAGLQTFSKEFSTIIVAKMKKDGVINGELATK
ncbi:MAG: hypothetical protein V4547_05455 [Bacteroidota bacterium]